MAYAGVAQANEDGKGMQVYSGRRVPLIYWDTSGEDYRRLRLSSRPIPIPGNTDSVDCPGMKMEVNFPTI